MKIKSLIPWNRENSLYKPENGNLFDSLQMEMNRIFDDFHRGFLDMSPLRRDWMSRGNLTPRVDVTESDAGIQVTAELPGVDEKDIEVNISGDTLTIKGEKKSEKEDKGKGCYRMERYYGSFQRAISLPAEIVPDKIEASFKRGILTVKLPKNPQAQISARKIPVKCD